MPDNIRASHILRNVDGRSKEDALREVEDIKAAIEDGADFAEQAREHSECPSSRSGGDLGDFGRGMMVAPFEEAAFDLGAGRMRTLLEIVLPWMMPAVIGSILLNFTF